MNLVLLWITPSWLQYTTQSPDSLADFTMTKHYQASSLSRLRHPCILEMAEPLEETRYILSKSVPLKRADPLIHRSTLSFATEPITASLRHAISASTNASTSSNRKSSREEEELELDEVEIQKGLSQLAKGLEFLHGSAKLVHGNLNGDSVVINAKVRFMTSLLLNTKKLI